MKYLNFWSWRGHGFRDERFVAQAWTTQCSARVASDVLEVVKSS